MERIDTYAGAGELMNGSTTLGPVRYSVTCHQRTAANGLPVPGAFRIHGTVDGGMTASFADLVGLPLGLKLADGRVLGVMLSDAAGTILSEGHGPTKCQCC